MSMWVYSRVLKKQKWDFTCPLESNGDHSLKWILLFHLVGGYDLTYTHIVHIMSCTADIKNCCNSTNAHIHRHIHRHIHIHIHIHCACNIYIYMYIYVYIYMHTYMYPNKKMGFQHLGTGKIEMFKKIKWCVWSTKLLTRTLRYRLSK